MEELKLAFERTIANILKHENFKVESIEDKEEGKNKLIAYISKDEIAKVIGQNGNTIKAIRFFLHSLDKNKTNVLFELKEKNENN